MRKSLVLALVLVFAIAGAAFAATPTVSGSLEATTERASFTLKNAAGEYGFVDGFGSEADLELGLKIAPEDGAWDATVTVHGLAGSGDATFGFYRLNVSDDVFSATVWGKHATSTASIGHKQDPFVFVRASGNNRALEPAFRVTSELAGVNVFGQLQSRGDVAYFFGDTELDSFKLGAAVEHTFKTQNGEPKTAVGPFNRYVVYGSAGLGMINLDAAFGGNTKEEKDNSAMGVKATAGVTEQVELSATFTKVDENFGVQVPNTSPAKGTSYKLGATYTEGVIQAKGEYSANKANAENADTFSVITLSATYRGSEDNLAFDDLFKGDKYFDNVAPAFSASYKLDTNHYQPASTLTVNATAPITPGQVWVKGTLTMKSAGDKDEQKTFNVSGSNHPVAAAADNHPFFADKELVPGSYARAEGETNIQVDAYVKVSDKLTVEPTVQLINWTKYEAKYVYKDENDVTIPVPVEPQAASATKYGVKATYRVAEDAKLTFSWNNTGYSLPDAKAEMAVQTTSLGLSVEF